MQITSENYSDSTLKRVRDLLSKMNHVFCSYAVKSRGLHKTCLTGLLVYKYCGVFELASRVRR